MDVSKKKRHLVTRILFVLYFIVLFYFLFFSERMGRAFSTRMYHYNLVPFREIRRFLRYRDALGMEAVLLNIAGNVLAFMPFGTFLPIFSARCRRLWRTVFYSFELSLLAELLQLVTRVGSFDVDDLLLNAIGGFLGFLVFLGLAHAFRGRNGGKTT